MKVGIKIEHALKKYGDNTVIPDLSLDIKPGAFFTLLGPSGCGKTTTLRILAGLLEADAGKVFLKGEDITSAVPEKRSLNTVFQNYALFPHMNVEKNISYGLRIRGVKKAPGLMVSDRSGMTVLSPYFFIACSILMPTFICTRLHKHSIRLPVPYRRPYAGTEQEAWRTANRRQAEDEIT